MYRLIVSRAMKSESLFSAETINVVTNGSEIASLEDLKNSGTGGNGIRLREGMTIEFPDEWNTSLVQVSTMRNGNTAYYIKCLLDGRAAWIAIGQLRRRPFVIDDLEPYSVNKELVSQANDYALLEYIKGKTLVVIDEVEFEFPAFKEKGGREYSTEIVDGKVILKPVLYKRPSPIFDWKK